MLGVSEKSIVNGLHDNANYNVYQKEMKNPGNLGKFIVAQ